MSTRQAVVWLLISATVLACRQDGLISPTHDAAADLAASRSADHGTILVDDDGADCPTAAYSSIQAAVTAAAPGNRILVCRGIYREEVTVTMHELRLLALGAPGDVVVDAHHREYGVRVVDAAGVTIEGFRVERAHEADIALHGARFSTVRKNVTTAAGHDGIQLIGAEDNLIEHNVVFDNAAANACGVNVTAGSKRNLVRHNELMNNEWGVQINGAASSDNVISGNRSVSNRGNGIRNIGGASGTIIERNHTDGNGHTPGTLTGTTGAGIRVASGARIVVRGNLAFDNRRVDLLKEAAAMATFEGNRCGTSDPEGLCEGVRP